MVSDAVSKMGIAGLFFIETGVEVNSRHYQDVLLSQQMLPIIRNAAGEKEGQHTCALQRVT